MTIDNPTFRLRDEYPLPKRSCEKCRMPLYRVFRGVIFARRDAVADVYEYACKACGDSFRQEEEPARKVHANVIYPD